MPKTTEETPAAAGKFICPDCGMESDKKELYCPKCEYPIAYHISRERVRKLEKRQAEKAAEEEEARRKKAEDEAPPKRRGAFESLFG